MGAETTDKIHLTLMDSQHQSSEEITFSPSETEISFDICAKKNLGDIVQVKLQKEKHVNYPWFCKHINVQTPSGGCFEFPCYCWLVDEMDVIIREGTARLPQDDTTEQRNNELGSRQTMFRILLMLKKKFAVVNSIVQMFY
ncbi:arachidonate 5-lipoxygenase [Labeo rohita]|uniref:Arachidonate 5-lipoxygenase n=1 Tax=Labeo rohita TaxID=84645 RepID=A0A498NWZ1_LABRO|nr:arachidonate 5-lipoxygenase [Labeo rohita]